MRLNLHLLRVFHTVAAEGSFSAAARRLHLSQPAVSKGVSELERQLDIVLIERGGRGGSKGLQLTEAGAALDAHARSIFALEHAAVEELRQRSGLARGSLVVGASTTVASYWLPRYLQMFTRRWPDIVLRVVVGNTHTIAEDLLDCELDVAVVEGPVHVDGLAYHPWIEERLIMIAPPGFGDDGAEYIEGEERGGRALWLSPTDLAHSTWLVREAGSGTREVSFDLLAAQGIRPRRTVEIGSNEGIARAVASGLGVAMLPFAVVEDLLLLKRVIELRTEEMTGLSRVLYRLERRDRPPSPAVGAFLDILAAPAQAFP